MIFRSGISDRQYNGQKKNDNDLKDSTQKTKDWATRNPLQIQGEYCFNVYDLELSLLKSNFGAHLER